MSSPAWELQKAVYRALIADTALAALLGGARIYDDVPRGAPFPYVTFGPSTTRDWSTGTDSGTEHVFTLRAWSKEKGEMEVHGLMHAIRTALHGAALTLAGHRLVNLRHETSDTLRNADGETYQGIARFRAVTEPGP